MLQSMFHSHPEHSLIKQVTDIKALYKVQYKYRRAGGQWVAPLSIASSGSLVVVEKGLCCTFPTAQASQQQVSSSQYSSYITGNHLKGAISLFCYANSRWKSTQILIANLFSRRALSQAGIIQLRSFVFYFN